MFSTTAHILYAKPASKKGPVVEEKALLGRPSNNLKSMDKDVPISVADIDRSKLYSDPP